MIPSFSLPQNGQPLNIISQQPTSPIYGAIIRQPAVQSQVQFQQLVPQVSIRQITNFGFNQPQNYNNMMVNSANMISNLGLANQNTFVFHTNQYTTTGQYLQQQNYNQMRFPTPQPIIAANSPPTLFSSQVPFISSPPINPMHMNQPQSPINSLRQQQPYLQQNITLNHVNFCPYQPPSCINQQRFTPNTGWPVSSEPSTPIVSNTFLQSTNWPQHPPILRMPTVIIRPNGNGRATIIQLNNYNQHPACHRGRKELNTGRCSSTSKIGQPIRPFITYNEEYLTANKGECSICLDDMDRGNLIARLPCLCIYHKNCIDAWFLRRNTCPVHPSDE
jgi:hypothetical protein